MKRLKLILILILSFSLTGCIQEYNYTVEESDAIAEYMAGRLLADDKKYNQELQLMEELSAVENSSKGNIEHPAVPVDSDSTVSNKNESEGGSKNEAAIDNSLSGVLGGKIFDINYKSYELAEIYPDEEENPYFSLTARAGYQLLVVSFVVTNKTDQEKEFNLSNIHVEYQLNANVDTIYKPQFTLLENDLRYIDVMLGANKSTEALLVFEVSAQADISNLKLTVTKDESTSTVEIK
jgi:hypothetical protein